MCTFVSSIESFSNSKPLPNDLFSFQITFNEVIIPVLRNPAIGKAVSDISI